MELSKKETNIIKGLAALFLVFYTYLILEII